MGTLYDEDILLWNEHQADLPRRAAAGERVNDGALDWLNISKEMERARRRAVQRLPQVIDGMAPLVVPDLSGVALEEWLVTD